MFEFATCSEGPGKTVNLKDYVQLFLVLHISLLNF